MQGEKGTKKLLENKPNQQQTQQTSSNRVELANQNPKYSHMSPLWQEFYNQVVSKVKGN